MAGWRWSVVGTLYRYELKMLLRDTRTILGICLSVIANNEIKGADGYGVFRL